MVLSPEDIEKRRDAVRRSLVDSQIEGQRIHPDVAKLLDAWARGEIDGDEVRRLGLARIHAEHASRQKTAEGGHIKTPLKFT